MLKLFKKRVYLFKSFFPMLINAKKNYAILAICSIITTILSFVSPRLYEIFINNVIVNKNMHLMFYIVVGFLLNFAINTFVGYIHFNIKNKFLNSSLFRLKSRLFKGTLYRPICSKEYDANEVKMRIEDDSNHLEIFIEDQTIDLLLVLIKIIVTIILLYTINVNLATYAILIIPITIIIENILGTRRGYYNDIMRKNQKNTNEWLKSNIINWRTVKSLNLQENISSKYDEYLDVHSINNSKWMNLWVLSYRIFPRFKDEFLMEIMLYFFGGLLIVQQQIAIGSLLVFIIYFDILKESVNGFAQKNSKLLESLPYLERLMDEYLLAKNNTDYYVSNRKNKNNEKINKIELIGVGFKYKNTDNWLFNNLNLQLFKGDIVAITGKSGVGKSTLAKIISGVEKANKGMILFDGIDINKIPIKELYKNIGYVMQNSQIFNTSILQNLRYSQNSSLEGVKAACKKACILDEILAMEEGFDTIVGDNGIKLSGGQKQRLILARQFLRNNSLIIFDEATSAIEPTTEAEIFKEILELSPEHIIIIISHRDSPISICNKIINLDEEPNVKIVNKRI